jgi:hypothetical protein
MSGFRRAVLFVTMVAVALTMGLEFAHVLEWPRKRTYSGALYVRLQESLYVWFGNLGGIVYVIAVLATVVLAVLSLRDRAWRLPALLAAAAEVVALVVFLTVVVPVNHRLPPGSGTPPPADWTALRDRWEWGHAIGFVLFGAAFLLLLTALVRWRGTAPAGSPSG